MGNNLKSICVVILLIIASNCGYANTLNDTFPCVIIKKNYINFKEENESIGKFKFRGKTIKQLLSNSFFVYEKEHSISTNNGMLLGWFFKLNNNCKIKVYFEDLSDDEKDNIYLHDINFNSIKSRKIKSIEFTKQRYD